MNMKWEKSTLQYTSGENLFLGKWRVGGIHYNSLKSKDDPLKYKATCRLPGIKDDLGHFEDEDKAKSIVEFAVDHWIKGAELK